MCTVYTITLTLLFANCRVLADSLEESDACIAIFNGTIDARKCCESSLLAESDETFQCINDDGDITCDHFKCLAEENELLVNDRISNERVKEMLNQWEKLNPKEKTTIDRVRRNCSGGKFLELLADSNESDSCEPLNFYLCVYINVIFECSSWKKDAHCNKMKEYTQLCKKFLDI